MSTSATPARLPRLLALAAFCAAALGVSPAWADKTVTLGLAAPLTGQSARIGKDLENGARLAIEDANKQKLVIGGDTITFRLQAVDDQSDPRVAVTVAQSLVDQGAVGVIGHWNTGTSIPAARVYHDAGIAQVAPAATGKSYTSQGFDTSFRIMGHDDVGGAYTGRYAVETLKARRIAVIDDRTAFGQGLADQFVRGVKEAGGEVVTREFVNDKQVDFDAILTRIKSRDADLVFFGGLDAQAALIVRRLQPLGLKARLIGAGGIVSQTFLTTSKGDGEGTIALEPGLPIAQMPGGQAFETRYREVYKQPIELHAPFAYDAAAVIIAAMREADSTDPTVFLPALRKIQYTGITGPVAFDAEGNLSQPAYTVYRVEQGKWAPAAVLGGKAAQAVASQ
ncbi:Leucine-, isoleucine-, valine-, threonine-, and alanine-binding protein [plant metagenome]|uniref:Leucine-, isoleucine-, valine-, threonine-, and alanine-binding protein n=1 Tax=plant metagenome TaxID=1297885 RepID=A0A484V067_9ZZZZ